MTGLLDLFFKDLRWTLSSQDDDFVVKGKFTTTDLVEDIVANYAEFRSLGRPQPVLMFTDNASDKLTFTARVFAEHNGLLGFLGDKVDDLINDLRSLPKPVAKLGRPRIFDFAVGESVSMPCVVETVGGIAYDRLRPATGDHRGCTAHIVLRRYEAYDATLSGRAAESLVQPFFEGESFESLAKRVYGNAALGEALRRRNPDKAVPAVGVFIHLPPAASLGRAFLLEPQSPTLEPTTRNLARRREAFRTRHLQGVSYTLGAEWHGVTQ